MTSLFTDNKIMPALFLGHGSPMNAIEENQFVDGFRGIAMGSCPFPCYHISGCMRLKEILNLSFRWKERFLNL